LGELLVVVLFYWARPSLPTGFSVAEWWFRIHSKTFA